MTITQTLRAADIVELITPAGRVTTYHGPRTPKHLLHELRHGQALARIIKANHYRTLRASDL